MDVRQMLSIGNRCTEEENAPCSEACPLKLDIRAFIKNIRDEKWDSAYQLYRKQSVFPAILSRICNSPCVTACIRSETGGGLELSLLERAVCEYSGDIEPRKYAVPRKNASAAVVGAGLAGLTAAVTLAGYGYRVELYEKESRPGGRLWEINEAVLPRDILQAELEKALKNQNITLYLNSEIRSMSGFTGGAVILAVGSNEGALNLTAYDGSASDTEFWVSQAENGIFYVGTDLNGNCLSPAEAIAAGKSIAQRTDWFLRGMKTEPESDISQNRTRLQPDAEGTEFVKTFLPSENGLYTKEEARKEAGRCIMCHCGRCVKACELLKSYRSYPKKYINDVYQNLNLVEKFSESICKRQIYSCNLCGECQAVCPEAIDMGDIYLTARRILYEKGSLPPAFHEFFINDMLFSNGEASLTLPGKNGNRYMFFPGCRIGAFLPNTVEAAYKFLSGRLQDQVALVLGCCGAPAYWAGREDLHSEAVNSLKEKWISLESPEVILACPSCSKLLRLYVPEIHQKMLWEMFGSIGLPEQMPDLDGKEFAVFDPCSAAEDAELKQNVRILLKSKRAILTPMKETGGCCGYGGLISYANPELLEEIVRRRISQSEAEYVTYCVNCRDAFLRRGKPTRHLLELIFPEEEEEQIPSLGKQRENRRLLSSRLQGKTAIQGGCGLIIAGAAVKEKLERQYILPELAYRAILHCEDTGYVLLNEESNTYTGKYQEGSATYWVEYKKDGAQYLLVNIYSHHIEIKDIL